MDSLFSDSNIKKSQSVPDSYSMNCPFCEKLIGKRDIHFHLNFNTRKKVYRCVRCNASGSLYQLKNLNIRDYEPPQGLQDFQSRAKALLQKNEIKIIDLDLISWPLNPEKTPIAYQYITTRGFTDEDIRTYHLRVGIPYYDEEKEKEIKKWTGRILFPFMLNGQCTYVVGRSYVNAEPRYLNSEGNKTLAIYNIDQIKGDKCILCEGIISSISAQKMTGIPAIAMLGKTINPYQIAMIRNRCSEIYLSLDGDTLPKEREGVKNSLIKAGFKVWMVELPLIVNEGKKLKDPDDFKLIYQDLFQKAQLTSYLPFAYQSNLPSNF